MGYLCCVQGALDCTHQICSQGNAVHVFSLCLQPEGNGSHTGWPRHSAAPGAALLLIRITEDVENWDSPIAGPVLQGTWRVGTARLLSTCYSGCGRLGRPRYSSCVARDVGTVLFL